MPSEALQMFNADPTTYVVPGVVLVGFYLHYRLQRLADLR